MTWDGVVTKYHKKYIRELEIQPTLEAYIQTIVLKKTLESISLDRRQGYDQEDAGKEEVARAVSALAEKATALRNENVGEEAEEKLIELTSYKSTTVNADCEGQTSPYVTGNLCTGKN